MPVGAERHKGVGDSPDRNGNLGAETIHRAGKDYIADAVSGLCGGYQLVIDPSSSRFTGRKARL
jgi:hypothetical protein